METLHALAARANTREDFLAFLRALAKQAAQEGHTWENATISDFLEALAAWAADADGYYGNITTQLDLSRPSWRFFAEMLSAARGYE